MKFKLTKELPAIIVAILPIVYLASMWKEVPEIVPMHWNYLGEIDRYGSKYNLIWLSILIPILTYLILVITPRFKSNENLNKMGKKLHKLKLAMTFIMSILTIFLIQSSISGEINVNIILAITGLLFAVIGNFMPTMKYNHSVGIRIPPTLKNEEIWKATHRYASRMWMIGGCSIIVMSLLTSMQVSIIYFLATTCIMIVLPTVYAYRLTKRNIENN